ncbi:MAG TPA: TetR/AcrR family transcriptional regulator [Chondromyces sp.]|nr:TetR/AcrR family transcriptional regulator [Chondromyces sp.]
MNDRKQHVIKMAHQLFIDKGFQRTSIQDILDYSGISKGTFYNYFPSKNELLIALFKVVYKELEKERNDLLVGQDPSNIEIFIKQVQLQMETSRTSKLISLFEEVNSSDDKELKQFVKKGQLRGLSWLYLRFIDIFGESKERYLLDCAIMFMGMLQHNLKYNALAYGQNTNIHQIVRYSVERLVKMVEEVSESKQQLIQPNLLEKWLPTNKSCNKTFLQELHHTILSLKKHVNGDESQLTYMELLNFIQDELFHSEVPRKSLIESALFFLKNNSLLSNYGELDKLNNLIKVYFTKQKTDL